MANKKKKFKKVVKWSEDADRFNDIYQFLTASTILFIFIWILSPIWSPIWFIYKIIERWKEDREVYWEQVK